MAPIHDAAAEHFAWERLGDLQTGRPNLGNQTSVQSARLMFFTLAAVLIADHGREAAGELVRRAGRLAGRQFCAHMLDKTLPVSTFLAQWQQVFREEAMGLIRVEEADPELARMSLTVAEDLECSGIPIGDGPVCTYDEGFIAGVLEEYTGHSYVVREVECWALGDRICRFEVIRSE